MEQTEVSQKPVDILATWESTGLLKAARTDHQRKQLARILENQRLFNATAVVTDDLLKRLSYPIICRIYGNLTVLNLVSYQSMDSLEFKVTHKDKYGHPQQSVLSPGTRRLTMQWNYLNSIEGRASWNNIENTKPIVDEVSQEISMDLSREIVSDLANVAATNVVREWKPSNLFDAILIASAGISKRVGYAANWLVASQPLAMEIAKLPEWESIQSDSENWAFKKIGRLSKKWDVYVDPLLENSNMVLGFKGDEYTTGYYFCPYIPLIRNENGQMLCRLGKKLTEAGFYARISFENYYNEEEIVPVFPESPKPVVKPVEIVDEEIFDEVPLEISTVEDDDDREYEIIESEEDIQTQMEKLLE